MEIRKSVENLESSKHMSIDKFNRKVCIENHVVSIGIHKHEMRHQVMRQIQVWIKSVV